MDKIWYENPSKSETQNRQNRTLKTAKHYRSCTVSNYNEIT